jgi:hypothetical protein
VYTTNAYTLKQAIQGTGNVTTITTPVPLATTVTPAPVITTPAAPWVIAPDWLLKMDAGRQTNDQRIRTLRVVQEGLAGQVCYDVIMENVEHATTHRAFEHAIIGSQMGPIVLLPKRGNGIARKLDLNLMPPSPYAPASSSFAGTQSERNTLTTWSSTEYLIIRHKHFLLGSSAS